MATRHKRQPQRRISAEEKDRLIRSFIVKFLDLASSEETTGRLMLAELKAIKAQLAQFQLWEQDGYTSNESRALRCAGRLRQLMRTEPPTKPKTKTARRATRKAKAKKGRAAS